MISLPCGEWIEIAAVARPGPVIGGRGPATVFLLV